MKADQIITKKEKVGGVVIVVVVVKLLEMKEKDLKVEI